MRRVILVSACILAMSACTTIKIDKGDTTTIEHTGGATEAKALADRACHRAGSGVGEVVSTANKDPSLPAGTGKQVTTFRCTTNRS